MNCLKIYKLLPRKIVLLKHASSRPNFPVLNFKNMHLSIIGNAEINVFVILVGKVRSVNLRKYGKLLKRYINLGHMLLKTLVDDDVTQQQQTTTNNNNNNIQ